MFQSSCAKSPLGSRQNSALTHRIKIVKYILFWSETDICFRSSSCRRQFRLTLWCCKDCPVTASITNTMNTLKAEFGRSTVLIKTSWLHSLGSVSSLLKPISTLHFYFRLIKLHVAQEYQKCYAHSMSPHSNPVTGLSRSSWSHCRNNIRAGETFWDRVSILYTDFEDILSRAHRNF